MKREEREQRGARKRENADNLIDCTATTGGLLKLLPVSLLKKRLMKKRL